MSTQRPLTELVIAARDGDSAAWESLVECYAGLVWWVCRRHRLSDSDAADVSQTVWLRLVEHLPSLREPKALPGWLDTTARHECLRLLRTRQRQCRSPLEAELVDLTAGPDEHALGQRTSRGAEAGLPVAAGALSATAAAADGRADLIRPGLLDIADAAGQRGANPCPMPGQAPAQPCARGFPGRDTGGGVEGSVSAAGPTVRGAHRGPAAVA